MTNDCDPIRVECEHRLTTLEVVLMEIKDNDLKHIQRWIWAIFGTVVTGALAGVFL